MVENLNRTAIGLPVKKTFLNFMKGEQRPSIAEAVSTSAHGSSLDQGKGSMGSGIVNEYGGERGRNIGLKFGFGLKPKVGAETHTQSFFITEDNFSSNRHSNIQMNK